MQDKFLLRYLFDVLFSINETGIAKWRGKLLGQEVLFAIHICFTSNTIKEMKLSYSFVFVYFLLLNDSSVSLWHLNKWEGFIEMIEIIDSQMYSLRFRSWPYSCETKFLFAGYDGIEATEKIVTLPQRNYEIYFRGCRCCIRVKGGIREYNLLMERLIIMPP